MQRFFVPVLNYPLFADTEKDLNQQKESMKYSYLSPMNNFAGSCKKRKTQDPDCRYRHRSWWHWHQPDLLSQMLPDLLLIR